ncbi:hypothetical protein GU243_19515 [Pseudarthrobacter psychrotolerans]|uniref:Uncharacterized protein n=1 Tax=Pseudarthrobacter psychrotolerans TaxID=2697569 RepID=A0A6P1NVJ0_9MICC|nr:hypothetical protein [Pseudarthrobacter psychrotolerans]QHK21522.1 hypothetical protein GU243_19515 [Pseudarthrobacter psychrotolerans]
MNMSLSLARAVADAVLYEGYLLYPYRASSQKNQARWQFGILGPPGAAAAGTGEEPDMFADCLLTPGPQADVEIHVRFLQLQSRTTEKMDDDGGFTAVDELTVGAARWLSWDEAVEREVTLGPFPVAGLSGQETVLPVAVPGGEDTEELRDASGRLAGRLVRRRRPLQGEVRLEAAPAGGALLRLRISVANRAANTAAAPATSAAAGWTDGWTDAGTRQYAIAESFIGTHLLLSLHDADFVSLLEPPPSAQAAAATCKQHRCWPVLAGPEGQSDVLLVSPIILYDHPAVAPESSVALYDSTEIDEILTLRVLTLTEEEKAEARATDPRAAAIIDRCEAMSPAELQQLHGILRNPHALDGTGLDVATLDGAPDIMEPPAGRSGDEAAWWTPEAEALVQPHLDAVLINGVPVSRGSRVRVNPSRRADAQDLFFAGQTGRVTNVHFDVDGSTHVGLVLDQDPAADLHEGYGRSFYYSPEELEPLGQDGKESPP